MNNTYKNLSYLLSISFLQLCLFTCSGSSESNKAAEVITEGAVISTYVDKDLGARLTIENGASLLIPAGALPESQMITMRVFKSRSADTSLVDLQPSDVQLQKNITLDVRMPLGLADEFVEAYTLDTRNEANTDKDEITITDGLDFKIKERWLSTELKNFSQVAVLGSDLLNIVFQIPSQFLLPGDVEYNLSADNRWQTGHARMYLGFDIETSPRELSLETGTQEFLTSEQKVAAEEEIRNTLEFIFPNAETFVASTAANQGAVYIDEDTSFRSERTQWLYMGAKRRKDMLWQNRIELAVAALEQEGQAYFSIGDLQDVGFSSTSLVEYAYKAAGFALETFNNVNELLLEESVQKFIDSPLPVLQFKSESLEDINSITVYESGTDGLVIPIYGVSRADSPAFKSYSVICLSAAVHEGDEELLANFDSDAGELDLSFIYQKEDDSPWQITFHAEVSLNEKVYSHERTLTINVAGARPVFSDNFLSLQLSDKWTSDESQIDGSAGVVLNQVAGVLSITTPLPSSDCDSHFLWTPELNLSGNFSIEYSFIKNGFGRSALLITSDGVRDGGANDNALEFYIATDSEPYLGVVSREAGVDSDLYQIDNADYLNTPLVFKIDRVDNEYHFYINSKKVPQVFSHALLNSDSTMTLALETSACSSNSGNGVDRANNFSVNRGASVGFENMALSITESLYGDDHSQVCVNEFGSIWQMADWTDLDAYFAAEKDMNILVSELGFDERDSAWVLREGDPSADIIKDYFVAYHNHEKPDSFASYDDIDEDFFNLGAALTPKYVLCKKP